MSGLVVTRAGAGASTGVHDADPVRSEVVRHGLDSAANQMKRALVRTAFSPIVYEVLDFAVALYDRDVRMLAQAPSLPLFMGRLSFCVENAVAAIGGESVLEPGDVILYNHPFGTGSHPQDAALVMPVFLRDEELVGYAAVKAHWLDIGGKEPYSTDTVDVFQEGTIFPGVKLYRAGKLVPDIYRMLLERLHEGVVTGALGPGGLRHRPDGHEGDRRDRHAEDGHRRDERARARRADALLAEVEERPAAEEMDDPGRGEPDDRRECRPPEGADVRGRE